MGSEAEEIIFKPKAIKSIKAISKYIAEKGYLQTSIIFADRLYAFGESLLIFPDKYPICRFPKLAQHNLRCAVFDSTYIFIYKVVKGVLSVYNVIHGKALK